MKGLNWEWESFPEYLDALDRMPRTIDIGAQIPHHPLRVYVMGDRAINREAATPEDIDTMRRLTEAALNAGAFGFTTSRTYSHKTKTGELVPGHFAEEAELFGIGRALGAVGRGAFGMNSDFIDEARELAWMTKLSKETGRPVWFLLTDRPTDPERWKRLMTGVHAARAQGASITAQVAGRPVGVILGHNTSMNPFTFRPAYRALDRLPAAERWARLRDPEMRAAILAEPPSEAELNRQGQFIRFVATRWDRMFVMAGATPDYEPTPEKSIAAIAARGNRTPQEVAYDYLTEGEDHFLFFPVVGYVHGDHEQIRQLLVDPGTLLGLGDGGAHCGQIVDAGLPSYMLSHWARDRNRGPGLPLPLLVKMQTSETAHRHNRPAQPRSAIQFQYFYPPQTENVQYLPPGAPPPLARRDGTPQRWRRGPLP